jgi:hypothetical protein
MRVTLLLRLEPWLKDDDCGLHRAARCICIEVLVDLSPSGPQTLSLVALCCPTGDLARTIDEVDRHVPGALGGLATRPVRRRPSRSWPW